MIIIHSFSTDTVIVCHSISFRRTKVDEFGVTVSPNKLPVIWIVKDQITRS